MNRTHREIIDLWPTRVAMAKDLDIKPSLVRKWFQRNSIPSVYWCAVSRKKKAKITELARAKRGKK